MRRDDFESACNQSSLESVCPLATAMRHDWKFMNMKNLFPAFAAGLMLAASFTSFAQDENAAAQKPRAGRRLGAGPGQFADGAGPLAGILTEEQRASMAKSFQSQRESMRDLAAKMRE